MVRLIDHTADFGIELEADSARQLFEDAAMALFDLMVHGPETQANKTLVCDVRGQDWADLMVNWLRELLYLFNGEQLRLVGVEISRLDENHLKADLVLQPLDIATDRIEQEIKAVTYHQISVTERSGRWRTRVIFDV
jgi:SHS2 domain-containing protein